MKLYLMPTLVLSLLLNCSPKGTREKIEISFWHVMGGPLGKVLNDMIEEFNETHSPIYVKSINMGSYQTLSQKIMGSILGGKSPQIAQVYESWTEELHHAGFLVPIDKFINSQDGLSQQELDDIFPVFREDNTWKNEYITFPFNKSVPAYFYNKNVLNDNKIQSFPLKWHVFKVICKKIKRSGLWGTAFPISTWLFECMLLQNGGIIIDDSGAGFNRVEGIEALSFLTDLIYEDSVAYLTTGFQHQDDFLMGKVGMITGSSVSYSFIKDKLTFELGIAPLPYFKKPAVIISGTNIAIFKSNKEKEQASWKFIKWFTSPQNQARWSLGTGYLPIRRSSLKYMDAFFKEVPDMERVIAQLEYAYFEPRCGEWFAGRRYLAEDGLEPALRGKKEPKDALDFAAKKINLELK